MERSALKYEAWASAPPYTLAAPPRTFPPKKHV